MLRASPGTSPLAASGLGLVGIGAVAAVLALAPDAVGPLAAALAVAFIGVVAVLAFRLTAATALTLVVGLSLAAQGSDEGVDILEVVFGLALVSYLGLWYGTALVGGRRFIRNGADVAWGLYLLGGAVVGTGLGILLGSFGVDFRSDLTALLALSIYFPVREVCARSPRGGVLVGGLLLFLGVWAAGVNAGRLVGLLSGATQLYEVVDVRVASGEIPMTASLLCALPLLAVVRRRPVQVLLLGVVVASVGGLVLAKSRGPWLTAILGAGIVALLLAPRERKRLIAFAVVGVGFLVGASFLALGNDLFLIGVGLLRRFTSLSTAATADISLLNRYYESAAAWDVIRANPILGYGWGAPVRRYDTVTGVTSYVGFLHNGYLWLWHKVGLWGLVLSALGYVGVILQGVRAARGHATPVGRALAAGGVGALVAYAVLGLPSNPFAVADQVLIVGMVLGLVSGVHEQNRAADA